jgi:hypothetical protein
MPVAWSTWLSKGITDEPESGGGLMVAAIQLSIMLGAAFGGLLLDYISIAATLIGGTILLALASLIVGNGDRIGRVHRAEKEFNANILGTLLEASIHDVKEKQTIGLPFENKVALVTGAGSGMAPGDS